MRAAIYTGFLFVILCTLLAVATSASAECTWLLWQEDQDNIHPSTAKKLMVGCRA
ncbi:MAG: hypothetical protein Q7W02_10745 [Candidatus Rokubacteria bacterium]|nr:hypothetical protein [Candidatus Rokubacteria bacterium]